MGWKWYQKGPKRRTITSTSYFFPNVEGHSPRDKRIFVSCCSGFRCSQPPTSLNSSVVKLFSQWMCVTSFTVSFSLCVIRLSSSVSKLSCVLPPSFLMVLSMAPLSRPLIFPPQDERPKVRTPDKREELNNCSSWCPTLKDFSFRRQKRRSVDPLYKDISVLLPAERVVEKDAEILIS